MKKWRFQKMNFLKKHFLKILLLIVIIYVASIFISQQKMINAYSLEVKNYESKIEDEKNTNKELLAMKENLDSTEYIEKIARDKLDMYLPNERVYIDIAK